MLGPYQSPKRPRDVQKINAVDALTALENNPIYEEMGGRHISFGTYEATKMGYETIISDVNGNSVTVPTREIESRMD